MLVGDVRVLGTLPTTWTPESSETSRCISGVSHALRQLADAVFSAAQVQPRLLAEIESFETLAGAARTGLGAIVAPRSVAEHLARRDRLLVRPFGEPNINITLSLCVTAQDMPSTAARVYVLALQFGKEIAARLGAVNASSARCGSDRGRTPCQATQSSCSWTSVRMTDATFSMAGVKSEGDRIRRARLALRSVPAPIAKLRGRLL